MSLDVYEAALSATAPAISLRLQNGRLLPLDGLDRWRGGLDAADRALLDRVDGRALDIGCGPGRLVAALAASGLPALGVDIAGTAVALGRARGASVHHGSIWDPLPGGRFHHVLLADGNIGIGGDPVRLLRRVGELLAPDGRVHVEALAPGAHSGPMRARLESAPRVGSWFDWATVAADDLAGVAEQAGLRCREVWEVAGRWFGELVARA